MRCLLSVRFEGRVQGVGFRYTLQGLARDSGVDGFVRNESDGSVYMEAVGDRRTLEDFLQAIHRSRVGRFIDKEYTARDMTDRTGQGFEIRFR